MKWTLTPKVDYDGQTIALDIKLEAGNMAEVCHREVINLKEKAIREALIALGWIPPVEDDAKMKHRRRDFRVGDFVPARMVPWHPANPSQMGYRPPEIFSEDDMDFQKAARVRVLPRPWMFERREWVSDGHRQTVWLRME